jgi:hypothetical protein
MIFVLDQTCGKTLPPQQIFVEFAAKLCVVVETYYHKEGIK